MDRAVLDADVIFSRTLHDLLGRVGTQLERFELIWSDELITEARQSLINRKGLNPRLADQWVGFITSAFPDGRVEIHCATAVDLSILTSDPDDEHICALALTGEADLLITLDRAYDSKALADHGVTVTHPDDFLTDDATGSEGAYQALLTEQAADWKPAASIDELLDALGRASLPRFTNHMRDWLDDSSN